MNWLPSVIAAGLTIAFFVSVPAVQRAGERLCRAAESLARRRGAAEAIVFFLALLLGAIPSIIWSVPLPVEADEISNVLAADTFAHGRLTNPGPLLPELFETPETIVSPTYASKYPPGLGLAMALPMKLFHLPILGLWITSAIGCALIVWMLRTILPADSPHWAFFGGLLAAMHPLVAKWNQTYWGGNLSMIGGTLLLGAVPLLANRQVMKSGFVAGAGLAILALSRPFEGMIVAVLIAIASLWLFRAPIARCLAIFLAGSAVLIPTFAFLAYDNHRVTGDWKLFPHQLYDRQYMVVPMFFVQKLPVPPAFHSDIIREMAAYELDEYNAHQGWQNYLQMLPVKMSRVVQWYLFPPTMLIASITGIVLIARGRGNRPVLVALIVAIGLPAIHLATIIFTREPYFAPALGAWFVLMVVGAQALGKRFGEGLVIATLLVTQLVACITQMPQLNAEAHAPAVVFRDQNRRSLEAKPGKHLVLVRYPPHYMPPVDFVFNEADLAGARVIYARSLDSAHDRAAIETFGDRSPWLLNVDPPRYSFTPYPQ